MNPVAWFDEPFSLRFVQALLHLQHAAWVRPLALSPDARTLAVGWGDGSIRLWDTTTWTELASCDGNKSEFVPTAARGCAITGAK